MQNLYISPGNYISGFDNLENLGEYVGDLSKKVLLLSDKTVYPLIKKGIESLGKNKIEYDQEFFNGECNYDEIDRLVAIAKENKNTGIIGFGGGKILDTIKAVGYKAGLKTITVPTNAATCAGWSSHSAIYTTYGIAYEYLDEKKNPDLLFMDKKIIFEAPKRYIISGILDTLAKWIETSASTRDLKNKNTETNIAIYLAKKSYEDMFKYSKKALEDIEKNKFTEAVDIIIENIILTAGLVGGIGGEACRAVAAHAVNNGFTALPKIYRKNLHGEVVGFGNIVQLILDEKEESEIEKVIKLYKYLDAPCGLDDMGYSNLDEDEKDIVINRALYKGDTIWNLPYTVNFDMLESAIKKADSLCKKVKK
ncbi:MAG: iron-containing alcohol dehydrogenase family protein [Fusobacteriota bacterium]